MPRVLSAFHHFEKILADIVDARLPISVWLDFAALDLLFKTRP